MMSQTSLNTGLESQTDYDFIIVGAGSAGCVLADRLSADPRNRVLLLEAGPMDLRPEIKIPIAFSRLFKTAYDWDYTTLPQQGLHGRKEYFAAGRTLGGSSSINGMVYMRGNPADYNRWAELGNPGWGWKDVLPYFCRSENNQRGDSSLHSADGPLHVQDLRDPNPLSRAFVQAAVAAGIAFNEDFNGLCQDGVGLIQVTQRRGRRWSTADAFLRPALQRRNLKVLTGTLCTRILVQDRRASGIEYLCKNTQYVARAQREVLLSGGTINSPQLLMLSGIGPAKHLQALGIEVVANLPGVGQDMQDHIAVEMVMGCTLPLSLSVSAATSIPEWLKYLLLRRGMLTSNGFEAAAFVRTLPDFIAPDLELAFSPGGVLQHGLVPFPGHGMTIAPVLLQPHSTGSLRLHSPNPLEKPIIAPNYLSDPDNHDLRVLVAGVRLAHKICAIEPLASYIKSLIQPDQILQTDLEIEDFLREKVTSFWHQVGTCRMGTDRLAVVDPKLRVYGIEGLRVVDASVMPTVPRGHINAPTIMIAERAADLMLG